MVDGDGQLVGGRERGDRMADDQDEAAGFGRHALKCHGVKAGWRLGVSEPAAGRQAGEQRAAHAEEFGRVDRLRRLLGGAVGGLGGGRGRRQRPDPAEAFGLRARCAVPPGCGGAGPGGADQERAVRSDRDQAVRGDHRQPGALRHPLGGPRRIGRRVDGRMGRCVAGLVSRCGGESGGGQQQGARAAFGRRPGQLGQVGAQYGRGVGRSGDHHQHARVLGQAGERRRRPVVVRCGDDEVRARRTQRGRAGAGRDTASAAHGQPAAHPAQRPPRQAAGGCRAGHGGRCPRCLGDVVGPRSRGRRGHRLPPLVVG